MSEKESSKVVKQIHKTLTGVRNKFLNFSSTRNQHFYDDNWRSGGKNINLYYSRKYYFCFFYGLIYI